MEIDPALRALVIELSDSEAQSLNDVGPVQGRFHKAIEALCDYVGVPNAWNEEVKAFKGPLSKDGEIGPA